MARSYHPLCLDTNQKTADHRTPTLVGPAGGISTDWMEPSSLSMVRIGATNGLFGNAPKFT